MKEENTIKVIKLMIEHGHLTQEVAEQYFPELAESDDEKIRKEIIDCFVSMKKQGCFPSRHKEQYDSWLAWLEKQGEHYNFRQKIQIGDQVTKNENGELVNLSQLKRVAKPADVVEKQGEPIDKIVKRAMNEKQRVLLTETNGDANINWDTRSLQDVKLLLEYGLDYIKKLEKQEEQKESYDTCVSTTLNGKKLPYGEKRDFGHFEKQGEQKLDDKVEPKFKVGDWIVYDGWTTQIKKVYKDGYSNTHRGFIPKKREEEMRLWTIQDAKEGDALATKAGGIFIYKELLYDKPFAYCGVDKFGVFKDCNCGKGSDWTPYLNDVTPATKEQRDQLEKAMADAGYTFDFEKKELKKIKQNTAWSEEDENMLKMVIKSCEQCGNGYAYYWLKSLKDRVQPQNRWKPSDE